MAGRIRQTMMTYDVEDGKLQVQLLQMPKQIFIWLGFDDSPRFGNLVAAVQTKFDAVPAAAALFGGDTGVSMAQRIARKTGLPVMLSMNLPASSPFLEVLAEKHVLALLAKESAT